MGAACILSCQKIESEEETVSRIFMNMSLAEIETKSAYKEFLKCVDEDGVLDFFLFKNYLDRIVGENNYKNAQLRFFENLRKLDGDKKNIKRIGALIVYFSKGSNSTKVEALVQHYVKFYTIFDKKTVKEFIYDMIETHTENCLLTFKDNLGFEAVLEMSEIFSQLRKGKLYQSIFSHFDKLNIKYLHMHKPVPGSLFTGNDKLNSSFDIEGVHDLHNNHNLLAIEEINQKIELLNKQQAEIENQKFSLGMKYENDEQIIKDFIQLVYHHLSGDYIRHWLYEEYSKDKPIEDTCV
jgi:hypothetical protein